MSVNISISISVSVFLNILFQIVSGGPIFLAEYVIVEANCTDGVCAALNDAMAVSTQCMRSCTKKNIFWKSLCE